ncbi:hypothetical protein R1G70_12945 [Stenotrophomonas sp. C960]|uniref:hypothetical protein n=1 Tax=unclassified Stenotrophomonas TaxID=196198 RepID=UPI00293CBE64|nr:MULTISPECIES: hypothetical protein [unclassified Stenotrophomonas]MDV3465564.1 hypothetical protein [Stenotrophomonas sp. C960]MDV3532413.1 hypothetical protein [Stenotrophomonas sp. C2866]
MKDISQWNSYILIGVPTLFGAFLVFLLVKQFDGDYMKACRMIEISNNAVAEVDREQACRDLFQVYLHEKTKGWKVGSEPPVNATRERWLMRYNYFNAVLKKNGKTGMDPIIEISNGWIDPEKVRAEAERPPVF